MEPFNWISNVPEISYNHLICTTQLLINPIEKNMLKCQSEKPLTISLSFKYAYNQWLSVSVGQTRQRDCLLFTSVWIELQKCPFEPHFCDLNVNKMHSVHAMYVQTAIHITMQWNCVGLYLWNSENYQFIEQWELSGVSIPHVVLINIVCAIIPNDVWNRHVSIRFSFFWCDFFSPFEELFLFRSNFESIYKKWKRGRETLHSCIGCNFFLFFMLNCIFVLFRKLLSLYKYDVVT